jgi:D-3-phosphoglycerate dehydrogenase
MICETHDSALQKGCRSVLAKLTLILSLLATAFSKILSVNMLGHRAAFGFSRAMRPARSALVARGLADIAVEHGRGQWKTYGDLASYKQGKFQIQTLNKISGKGLARFPEDLYDVRTEEAPNAHAILLRSHKLQEVEVAHTVRAIARCGAGTNNIPVPRMTELGIPVFNTPGANANAVKELVICGMLLGSRRIVDGINHMEELGKQGIAKERVEKDKAMFGGQEIAGKTLAVIGLGMFTLESVGIGFKLLV